jgi:hypothetical protein
VDAAHLSIASGAPPSICSLVLLPIPAHACVQPSLRVASIAAMELKEEEGFKRRSDGGRGPGASIPHLVLLRLDKNGQVQSTLSEDVF